MQKIFRLLLVAVAIIVGIVWFSHLSKTRAPGTTQVHNQQPDLTPGTETPGTTAANPSAPTDHAAPPQEVASTTPDASADILVPQHPGPLSATPVGANLSPHPANGFDTPSTQKFALYRQGDLTYRLNTQSGQACVLLATDVLWQKPLVYQHGCGSTK